MGLYESSLQMIYDRLVAEIPSSINIFSYAPAQTEGKPDQDFPYIVFGLDGARTWDTDDTLGKELDIYFHIWSRYKGAKETREIMDHIYSALHRAPLSATGVRVIDCLEAFTQTYQDPDGKTMHGISRYRLTIQEE